MSESLRIVAADAVGDLSRLDPLARKIFGQGDRAPRWFARKLHRECVDATLSRLAVAGGDLDDPRAWRGYALVGTPPSIHPAARTSGVGVVPQARGQGLGRRLLDAAARVCATAGLRAIRTPVAAREQPFYVRCGFETLRGLCTLHGAGRGSGKPQGSPAAWDLPGMTEVAGWLPETWVRTPARDRMSLEVVQGPHRLVTHFSAEGRAWVAHRLLTTRDPADAEGIATDITALLQQFGQQSPVLLTAVDPVSSVTSQLRLQGWEAVQSGELMRRPL